MTKNMKRIIAKNKIHKIISGYRVTSKGTEAKSAKDMSDVGGIKYRFDDGATLWMKPEDAASAPDYKPEWAEVR